MYQPRKGFIRVQLKVVKFAPEKQKALGTIVRLPYNKKL